MEIVTGNYQCSNCGAYFNWGSNSCRYGKLEYKTITERKEKEKLFCSDLCYTKYFKNENIQKRR